MSNHGTAMADWLFAVAVIPTAAIALASTVSAQQSVEDFPFELPAASCHPHCAINGSGVPEGDFFSMTFDAPQGTTVRNAQLICKSGAVCAFNKITPKQVSATKVVVEGLSRTAATSYVLKMDLAIAGQPTQLPPAAAVPPPPALADKARDQQVDTINVIRESALQICGTIPLDGTGGNVSLSADASAKTNGLVSKLFSAEAGAKAESDKKHYSNVLQADLPNIIRDNTNCRLAVFNALLEKLFPAK